MYVQEYQKPSIYITLGSGQSLQLIELQLLLQSNYDACQLLTEFLLVNPHEPQSRPSNISGELLCLLLQSHRSSFPSTEPLILESMPSQNRANEEIREIGEILLLSMLLKMSLRGSDILFKPTTIFCRGRF